MKEYNELITAIQTKNIPLINSLMNNHELVKYLVQETGNPSVCENFWTKVANARPTVAVLKALLNVPAIRSRLAHGNNLFLRMTNELDVEVVKFLLTCPEVIKELAQDIQSDTLWFVVFCARTPNFVKLLLDLPEIQKNLEERRGIGLKILRAAAAASSKSVPLVEFLLTHKSIVNDVERSNVKDLVNAMSSSIGSNSEQESLNILKCFLTSKRFSDSIASEINVVLRTCISHCNFPAIDFLLNNELVKVELCKIARMNFTNPDDLRNEVLSLAYYMMNSGICTTPKNQVAAKKIFLRVLKFYLDLQLPLRGYTVGKLSLEEFYIKESKMLQDESKNNLAKNLKFSSDLPMAKMTAETPVVAPIAVPLAAAAASTEKPVTKQPQYMVMSVKK